MPASSSHRARRSGASTRWSWATQAPTASVEVTRAAKLRTSAPTSRGRPRRQIPRPATLAPMQAGTRRAISTADASTTPGMTVGSRQAGPWSRSRPQVGRRPRAESSGAEARRSLMTDCRRPLRPAAVPADPRRTSPAPSKSRPTDRTRATTRSVQRGRSHRASLPARTRVVPTTCLRRRPVVAAVRRNPA